MSPDNVNRLLDRIERLNAIGIALSAERDNARLLETILQGAREITRADGGSLYLLSEDRRALSVEIMMTESLGFAMGGSSGRPVPLAPIPLYDAQDRPVRNTVVACSVLQDRSIVIADAYAQTEFDTSGTRHFDAELGYRSRSFLTVPLKNHEHEIIGALQLINARGPSGDICAFSESDRRLAESLASQAAIALTQKRLIAELQHLFEALVKLIATAIDEKSPYTAAHCKRVPVLTLMLAEAAHRTREGPLQGFSLSEADRYELEMAAWLHDCGKITTPEHVMDKATKLQTIFDRLELVDTRLELLRRDAEIRMLRRRLGELGAEPGEGDAELLGELAGLDAERRFLREINKGGERMSAEDQQRIRDIGRRAWCHAERGPQPLLSEDEIANLCIPKGTLTSAERQVINNHIVATIRMLESLPFPKHLQRVPEYAGGHHERMDGKGYPRGLTRAQLSVPARIMAIADIFEALTDDGRPYKDGMRLSNALSILERMRHDDHIDPDLYEVFMREKVYLEYARRFLPPEQIDVT